MDLFRRGITPHHATLIDPDDPNCSMRLQTVARLEEMEVADFEREDPVAEDRDSPVPGLTHRYPDRVLLLITRECTPPATRAAMERLVDAGIPTGNQTVLMKGINDCPVVIHKLLHELEKVRCRPYYLYNCDLAEGLSHFRTPVDTGLSIMESLWGHTSGYAIPTYIVDSPQGGRQDSVVAELSHVARFGPCCVAQFRRQANGLPRRLVFGADCGRTVPTLRHGSRSHRLRPGCRNLAQNSTVHCSSHSDRRTHPGARPCGQDHSAFPRAARTAGVNHTELICSVLGTALARNALL